jgi:hypothetical protein
MCTLVVHMLLHIADSIEMQGPSWVYWSFVMERHCGVLLNGVKSRVKPWASLNSFVLDEAYLQCILNTYNLPESFFGAHAESRAKGKARRTVPGCEAFTA